jgi:hypothetical protein
VDAPSNADLVISKTSYRVLRYNNDVGIRVQQWQDFGLYDLPLMARINKLCKQAGHPLHFQYLPDVLLDTEQLQAFSTKVQLGYHPLPAAGLTEAEAAEVSAQLALQRQQREALAKAAATGLEVAAEEADDQVQLLDEALGRLAFSGAKQQATGTAVAAALATGGQHAAAPSSRQQQQAATPAAPAAQGQHNAPGSKQQRGGTAAAAGAARQHAAADGQPGTTAGSPAIKSPRSRRPTPGAQPSPRAAPSPGRRQRGAASLGADLQAAQSPAGAATAAGPSHGHVEQPAAAAGLAAPSAQAAGPEGQAAQVLPGPGSVAPKSQGGKRQQQASGTKRGGVSKPAHVKRKHAGGARVVTYQDYVRPV